MKLCIDNNALIRNDSNIREFIILLSLLKGFPTDEDFKSLLSKGIIATDYKGGKPTGYRITNKGNQFIDDIIADSEPVDDIDTIVELATTLKEIFPKGKKDGTSLYWSDGTALIVRRLKLFFKKYGNDFTHEQILTAAKKYVEGFNTNYTYMQVLKYFIFKEKRGIGGEVEGESQLINYIENAGQEENLRNDWTSTIV